MKKLKDYNDNLV